VDRTRRGIEQAKTLGSRVREHRTKIGMSQEGLGEAAGLHRTYIGHLERGEVNPSLVNILKISAALSIDASVLVTDLTETIGDPRLF
jgi:transcriptional regulator with XRE-family HTH domain